MSDNLNIKEFLDSLEIEYREVASDHFNLKECIYCGNDTWHFYMNKETGAHDCKKCGAAHKSFFKFKAQIGKLDDVVATNDIFAGKQEIDKSFLEGYEKQLDENDPTFNKPAFEYLTKTRGFSIETIKKFRLGADKNFVIFPQIKDGVVWNLRFKNFIDKDFRSVAGQPSLLFNMDGIDRKKRAIVITEGETDCIAAYEMGVRNVVGITLGGLSFPIHWIEFFKGFKEIYICLDNDLVGRKGAKRVAEKLGVLRCKYVTLPVKDVNDYLLQTHKSGSKDFTNLLLSADKMEPGTISSISDYVNDLDAWFDDDGSITGMPIPFTKVNSYLNGFKEEDFIILSGTSGVGKSTICLNILNDFLKNGKKCMCFFLEGKLMFYILRMMCIETGLSMDRLREDPEKWNQIKKQFSSYPLYFYSGPQSDMNIKKLIELSEATIDSYGVDFIAVDNLQKIVVDNRDVVHNIGQAITSLKNLAVDKKIPVLLIAHVRKPQGKSPRISMYDAKNSSEIYQQADIYLVVWNNKKDNFQEDNMYLTIEKNRMGEGGLDFRIIFEKECGRFYERVDTQEIAETDTSKFENIKKTKKESKKEIKKDGFKPIVKIKEDDEL